MEPLAHYLKEIELVTFRRILMDINDYAQQNIYILVSLYFEIN